MREAEARSQQPAAFGVGPDVLVALEDDQTGYAGSGRVDVK